MYIIDLLLAFLVMLSISSDSVTGLQDLHPETFLKPIREYCLTDTKKAITIAAGAALLVGSVSWLVWKLCRNKNLHAIPAQPADEDISASDAKRFLSIPERTWINNYVVTHTLPSSCGWTESKTFSMIINRCPQYVGLLPKDIQEIAVAAANRFNERRVFFYQTSRESHSLSTDFNRIGLNARVVNAVERDYWSGRIVINHAYWNLLREIYHELCHIKFDDTMEYNTKIGCSKQNEQPMYSSTYEDMIRKERRKAIRKVQEMRAELGARYYLHRLDTCDQEFEIEEDPRDKHPTAEEHTRYIDLMTTWLKEHNDVHENVITFLTQTYKTEKEERSQRIYYTIRMPSYESYQHWSSRQPGSSLK